MNGDPCRYGSTALNNVIRIVMQVPISVSTAEGHSISLLCDPNFLDTRAGDWQSVIGRMLLDHNTFPHQVDNICQPMEIHSYSARGPSVKGHVLYAVKGDLL